MKLTPASRAMHGAKSAALSAAHVRQAWGDLIEAAVKMAARTIDSEGREQLELFHFNHHLGHRPKFPLAEAHAQCLADSFVLAAKAFGHACAPRMDPRTRVICATALKAAAEALDTLLVARREAAARGWQRQMGED